jgi:hypothetical protein
VKEKGGILEIGEARDRKFDSGSIGNVQAVGSSFPATIEMKIHVETDTDALYADPSQIQQVIMNLSTNAACAMRGTQGSSTPLFRGSASLPWICPTWIWNPEIIRSFPLRTPGVPWPQRLKTDL